ncbi:MAG: molybdopterin-binding protein [Candidatus Methanomethylophilus sp.]|nr:molybdopterin-binding protein [Methanomethylophilus sp.]
MVKRYLDQITLEKAVEIIKTIPPVIGSRHLPLIDACGHVLAESLYAKYSVPEVPTSAMDGFAVRSQETSSAGDQNPVTLTSFERVNTGNVIAKGFDAVIKVEDAWFDEQNLNQIVIRKSINPGTNIRPPGEDIKKDQLILPSGTKILPFNIGAIAAYGFTSVKVKRILIGIIPTGTELIAPGTRPAPGQVVESNTLMAEAYLRQFGADVVRYPPVTDNKVLIHGALEKATDECDIVIVSAGSSAGTKDFTASVIAEIGELLFHGIAIKPGKPAMVGIINKKPVFGLPGYPLAAQTILRVLVSALIEHWGWNGPEYKSIPLVLGSPIASDGGIDEFGLYAAARVEDHYTAIPLSRGASVQMTGVRSNCIVHIPLGVEGYETGEVVDALLMVEEDELDKTVLICGVDDGSLERLTERCMKEHIRIRVGPASGISAIMLLKNGSCHLASVQNEEDCSLCGIEYQTKKLGSLLLVTKKELTDKKVRRVLDLATEI